MPNQTSQYNTQLSPGEERQFQDWARETSHAVGRDILRDLADYNLRGYWLYETPDIPTGPGGHMPDEYKKPGHPTFSEESMWSNPFNQGGRWSGQSFTPSSQQLQRNPLQLLLQYLQANEPGATLNLPLARPQRTFTPTSPSGVPERWR